MDLSYGEEHERFRQEVRDFLEKHREVAPPPWLGGIVAFKNEKVLSWQRLLVEHGYAARTIPKEYGGYGAEPDPLKRIIIDEEFTRTSVSRGIGGQGPDMLVPTLLEHGTEEQKRTWIAPTIRGEVVWCQGYSEPEAGSDLASLQTSAVEDGDEYVVNGHKIWTTTAQFSEMMFALVRTDPKAKKHAGISYLLIPMDAPGIEVRPLYTMTEAAEFNEVFLTDVRVPRRNLVGRPGEGWKIGNTTLLHERNMLGNASQIKAGLQGLVELMHEERFNGSPVIADPVFRDRLAKLQARVLAMQYHSLRLLTHRLRGEWPGVAAMIVKLAGCQLNHDLARLAIDALGELGTLYKGSKHERGGGRWQFQYMLSLGLIIGGGTAQIQKNIIAERGLGLPREPKPASGGER
jgi:alkylation response protein AidB-like acyl-CoA dehydrogenase